MNKLGFYIALLAFLPLYCFSQDAKHEKWEQEKDGYDYRKSKGYKGPEDWYGSYPASISEDSYYENTSAEGGDFQDGVYFDEDELQWDRDQRYGTGESGNGDLPFSPEMKKPEPIEFPEFDIDPPDVDLPDVDLPDIDPPSVPISFWKVILFIIIAAAVLVVAYLIFKNMRPPVRKVIVDVEDDWNPEVITKSELQTRLDEALSNEDYREGVRVYFTFILKELIHKSWITWKKEKTNHQYYLELQGKPNQHKFAECVHIYDLVWYGEYTITKDVYQRLKPTLESYYQSLEPSSSNE